MTEAPHILRDDRLERARRHIQAHLTEPLSLAGIAAVAGLSAYHFTRQFTARFGTSPMAFVRGQRLAAAALRLRGDPPPSLIELAFDCGFDSQEGFTRAFKRAFGAPPGRYRQAGEPLPTRETPSMTSPAHLTQSPEPVRKPAMRIAGYAKTFQPDTVAGIPALWDQLVPNLPVAGQAGAESFGVCMGLPGSPAGSMRYMAGVPLAEGAAAPAGMEVVELTAQTYLVFRQVLDGGPLHPQMQAAAREIWGERLPKSAYKLAQAPDLEAYPADFRPDAPSHVEWWIPIEA